MADSQSRPMKIQNRRLLKCGGCGSGLVTIVDGIQVGGMPGLHYNYCPGCGWSRAITFKTPKVRLKK